MPPLRDDAHRLQAEECLRLARRHRISPLALAELARRMRAHDPIVAEQVSEYAARLRVKALRHAAALATLTTALHAGDVRHLAIKGGVLAQQLHGDVAARDSKDIDLLIDPDSIDRAAAILRDEGFAEIGGDDDGAAGDPFANKHRSFIGDGFEIELHTRLIDIDALLPLGFDAVWGRRESVAIGGVSIATLSKVDTLLYLCAHGASHLWFRLKWLEDIARIVAIGDAEAIAVARAIARSEGAEAVVLGALALVDALFGISPPGAPLPSTRASRALARLSQRALAAPAEHASRPPLRAILRKVPVQFALSGGWRYRARLAQALILAPRDFDVRTLPKGFGWMRLPLRPVMLILHRRRGT
nr:nucleotidyltransferase family protein [Sphingomonas sp. PAMC 26605]